MFRITIIGGGYCGTLLALQLLKQTKAALHINLLDSGGRFGPGLAFGPEDENLLLNVPAANMGAFPDDPAGFYRWLKAQPFGSGYSEDSYVPRNYYGRYLRQLLAEAGTEHGSSKLSLLAAEAVSLELNPASLMIRTIDGRDIESDVLVLALGNLPVQSDWPAHIPADKLTADPWRSAAWRGIPASADVLVLGSGLTAVDVISTLLRNGQSGKIFCLSRHGLLPQRHRSSVAAKEESAACLDVTSVRRTLTALRRKVESGTDWLDLVNGLRPNTESFWRDLAGEEQSRFLRHAATHWNIHRHRMPESVGRLLQQAIENGQLVIRAGRRTEVSYQDGRIRIAFRPRGSKHSERLECDYIIDCRGSSDNLRRAQSSLVQMLLSNGLLKPHTSGLGAAIDLSGYGIAPADGQPSRIFSLGNMLKGERWETTSVPDLRGQTQELAELLLART
jgi:uncharacterized NAD(P)/FAD-binding protein YdhS